MAIFPQPTLGFESADWQPFEIGDLFDHLQQGWRSLQLPGCELLYLNQATAKIYGREKLEFQANPQLWLEAIAASDRQRVLAAYLNLQTQDYLEIKYTINQPSGKQYCVKDQLWLMRKADQTPIGIHSLLTVESESTIWERTENLYRTLAQNFANCIVILYDRDYRYLLVEGQAELAAIGLNKEAMEGKTLDELGLSPGVRHELQQMYQQVLAGQDIVTDLCFQGQIYQTCSGPVRNEQGEIIAGVLVGQNITQTRQKEDLFQLMFEQAAIGINYVDLEGKFIQANQKFCDIIGYSREELMLMQFQDITDAEDLIIDLELFNQLINNQRQSYNIQKRYVHKQGHLVWVNLTISLLRDQVGNFQYCLSIIEDITDRKLAEMALQSTTKALKEAQRIAHIGNWERNLQTGKITWSEEVFHIHNLDPNQEEPTVTEYLQLIHPEDRAFFQHQIQVAIATGNSYEYDVRLLLPGGVLRYINGKGEVLKNSQGEPICVFGTVLDVTARKQIEEQLKQTQNFLTSVLENLPIAIIAKEAKELRYTLINKAAQELFGWNDLELIGKNDYDFFPLEQADYFAQCDRQALSSDLIIDTPKAEINTPQGKKISKARKLKIADENNQPLYLLALVEDITEQEHAAITLQEQEQFLRTIYNGVNQAIFTLKVTPETELYFTGWNPASERITGLSSELILGKPPQEVFPAELAEGFLQGYRKCLELGHTVIYEEYLQLPGDTKEAWFLTTLNPIYNEDQQITTLIGTSIEITAQKQIEEALRQSEARFQKVAESLPGVTYQYLQNRADDPYGKFVYMSSSAYDFFEVAAENILESPDLMWQLIHPDDVQGFIVSMMSTLGTHQKWRHEWRINTLSGQGKWVQGVATYEFQGDGSILWTGLLLDISTIKQYELERKQAEQFNQRLLAILEATPDFVGIATLEGKCLYLNQAGRSMIGASSEEDLSELHISETTNPECNHILLHTAIPEAIATGVWRGEMVIKHRQGQLTPVSQVIIAHQSEQGEPEYLSSIIRDISEAKAAEQALRASETQFRELAQREELLNRLANQIRNSLDIDMILETAVQEVRNLLEVDRCVFFWYHEQTEMPYWEATKEAKIDGVPSLIGTLSAQELGPLNDFFLQTKSAQIDNVSALEDTQLRDFFLASGYHSLLNFPIQTQFGKRGILNLGHCYQSRPWYEYEVELIDTVTNQVAIALNQAALYQQSRESARVATAKSQELEQAYRELQQTQTQLIQSEKMSSLGQLVAGVAHEINNPVNFIYGNITYIQDYVRDLLSLVELYQDHLPQPHPEISQYIQDIELDYLVEDLPKITHSMQVGAERIREIVKSLRTFSRLDEAAMKAIDIHENIDSTLMILQHRLKGNASSPGIEIIKNYADLPLVECYVGQLNQVFMNLLSNAIDAIEEAHQRQFESDQVQPHKAIYIQTGIIEKCVQIRIKDSGVGIRSEVIERIFDPFYTTKPVGKGTGLGLSISYQIVVEKHRGNLRCESTLGQGTTFIIEIPLQQ